MKSHIITFILLLLAAAAFILRFFVGQAYEGVFDVLAFVFPTLAAVAEIVISEKNGDRMQKEINKRPIWVNLTQEEYEKLKSEGKLDESTYYATYEETDEP